MPANAQGRRHGARHPLQDAVALLRMDDLYIDSFEIKDGTAVARPSCRRQGGGLT